MMTRLSVFLLIVSGCYTGLEEEYLDEEARSEGVLVEPPTPPRPRIMRDVANVDEAGRRHLQPLMPSLRTSDDGRVAVNLKEVRPGNLSFNLLRPETFVGKHFWDSSPGPGIVAYPDHYDVAMSAFFPGAAGQLQHVTFCESRDDNPRACGSGSSDDCYELDLIGTFREGGPNTRLRSRKIEVQVAHPKTSSAFIRAIRPIGVPSAAPRTIPVEAMFEPMIHRDGRLLVTRVSGLPSWRKPNGERGNGSGFNIVYAFANQRCDIASWTTDIYPIGYAQHHPAVRNRYGFARYPFRDPEGRPFSRNPDVIADLPGTYPWIDRNGTNLFFTSVGAELYYGPGKRDSRYPARCPQPQNCTPDASAEGGDGRTRGVAVMGLWTHGKAVLLDGNLNNVDYGVGTATGDQRELRLYTDGQQPVWVRVANGRGASGALPANTANNTFIDSIENRFNYHRETSPIAPRDVAWLVSRAYVTDEVVFDDFLDPNVLVFSEMNASLKFSGDESVYQDGFDDGFRHGPGQSTIRLQNAATSPLLATPAHGIVYGPARVEPVALGGVRGRGFWLGGTTRIEHATPAGLANRDWYIGVYVDTRATGTDWREVVRLPGANGLSLAIRPSDDRVALLERRNANVASVAQAQLPPGVRFAQGWRHIGLLIESSGRSVALFVDGRHYRDFAVPASLAATLRPGTIVLGGMAGSTNMVPFRGWVDEFKVVLGPMERAEVPCNHAGGTLVGIPNRAANPELWDRSAGYSERFVRSASFGVGRIACWTDYQRDRSVRRGTAPQGTIPLRDRVLVPEGALHASTARPDTSANVFCRSCHIPSDAGTFADVGRPTSLKLTALLPGSVPMRDDPRRQPMQPEPRLFGVVPRGLVRGPNGVARPLEPVSMPSGWPVDDATTP